MTDSTNAPSIDLCKTPSQSSVAPGWLAGKVLRVEDSMIEIADAFQSVWFHFISDSMSSPQLGAWIACQVSTDSTGQYVATSWTVLCEDQRGEREHRETCVQSDWSLFSNKNRARNIKKRAQVIQEVRKFFSARDYLEVETPVLVPSPGLDLHLDAVACANNRFLATSPEYQMKRMIVAGIPRIFQLSKAFRDGEIGQRHNPEFTMLEWYRAFATYENIIDETERLVACVLEPEVNNRQLRIFLGEEKDGRSVQWIRPFARMRWAEAFAMYTRFSVNDALAMAADPLRDTEIFEQWITYVEPQLAKGPPVFVTHFPSRQASLAALDRLDHRVAERFELYIGGVELCNGFNELTNAREQEARFLADQHERSQLHKTVYPIDEKFLQALQEGMPPTCGNALGLDRLVALAVGAHSLDEVIAFAHDAL